MNILVADDHCMVLEMLKDLIESKISDSTVSTAINYVDFEKKLRSDMYFDIAIMDYEMPGVDGIKTIKYLMKNYKHMSIAMMSGLANKSEMLEFLNLGVIGFIPKSIPSKAVISAINLMLTGERYIPSILLDTNKIIKSLPQVRSIEGLTPREQDVLNKLHLGYSNKEIALSLNLEEVTIKMHISRLCRKLNVTNRTKLIIKSINYGLVS